MIHDLIEPKKKTTVRNSATNNIKIVPNNSKIYFDNSNFEQSDSENKQAETSSSNFIPPWLKNSLGLNPRLNQNLDWNVCLPNFNALGHSTSNQKSARLVPKHKEENNDQLESKLNFVKDCCRKNVNNLDEYQRNFKQESTVECQDNSLLKNNEEKTIAIFWNDRLKESETESSCTSPEVKVFSRQHSNSALSSEIGKLKFEERKRIRMKQKNKLRKKIAYDLGKNDIDFLLEGRAREVMEKYKRKEIHSVSSDIKHLEAKLILLSAKCQSVDKSKLSQQELRLLREIKEQMGNERDFDKLIDHIKESNLKEILKDSDYLTKAFEGKMMKYDFKEDNSVKEHFQNIKQVEEMKRSNVEKDSILSTDDEDDIKRFSEFLSKNKNVDEKRKCLEEVRNYFERKRRTRLTKPHCVSESKSPRWLNSTAGDKNEDQIKEKLNITEFFSLPKEKQSKFGFYDKEIVEKAVNETLDKFVDFYHFRISPSVMGNMRKNILQAIRSDSLENNPPSHKSEIENNCDDLKTDGTLNDAFKNPGVSKKTFEDKGPTFVHLDDETTSTKIPYLVTGKNSNASDNSIDGHQNQKKRNFKSLSKNKSLLAPCSATENETSENENIKYLKKELEEFLHIVQNRGDTTKLKLQSIILEEDGQMSLLKKRQLVYKFGKNVMESHSVNTNSAGEASKEKLKNLILKNDPDEQSKIEQTSVKTQTVCTETCEQSLQTDEKVQVTNGFQTEKENMEVRELRELKNFDITPGLYRMVRSKEVGRFYLYPEKKKEKSSNHTICQKPSSGGKISEGVERKEKRKDLMKFLSKEKSTKEKRMMYNNKKKGKLRKTRRSYVISKPESDQKLEKEISKKENLEESLSCLYFRNCPNESFSESLSKKEEKSTLNEEDMNQNYQTTVTQSHLGCVWFWNGEQIPPGFDLKNHVEELLKEKLMEIKAESPPVDKFFVNEAFLSKDESIMTNNFESELLKSNTMVLPISNENSASLGDKKLVRHVGIQNSQPKLSSGSVSLARQKTHSKTLTAMKISRSKHKKKNLIVKLSHSQEKVVALKKTADLMKAVQELKKINFGIEDINGLEETTEAISTQEETVSSSTSKNFYHDPVTFVLGLKNKVDNEEVSIDLKNKFKRTGTMVDHECQTLNLSQSEEIPKKQVAETSLEAHKHWELIENVLNRMSHKDRKDLWTDIRDFIKTKIDKDINEDGEVCIEIEHDFPKMERGKVDHAILAKGQYTKNEGDVEVEIDLTLDDLERILRRRQKKIRRKHKFIMNKTRKVASSSSGQSEYTKEDLLKYQKYLREFMALKENLTKEKSLKMFLKSQNN